MNRFWLFSLFLSIAGALVALITLGESALTGWHGEATQPYWLAQPELKKWLSFGFVAGGFWGVGIALFDWLRNRHHDRTGIYASARLIPNLWWCLIYAGTIYLFNLALLWIAYQLIGVKVRVIMEFPWQWLVHLSLVLVLNVGALMWGSIRCITSEEVLAPDVLRSKLRRSSHLTG